MNSADDVFPTGVDIIDDGLIDVGQENMIARLFKKHADDAAAVLTGADENCLF